MSSDDQRQFQMTGRQQLVYRSIAEKSQELAELYECSWRVFRDDANPCRLLLAAHSIREMTDDLPKVFDLPILGEQGRLGDQMNALQTAWSGTTKSNCYQNGEWAGAIDGPLRKLLHALRKFLEWHAESRPKRRNVAATMFREADPADLPLPETIEKRRVERWLALHNYFVRVAHGSSTTDDEFQAHVGELEQILLDIFHRQPSEDLSVIDSILAEEAPDA